MGRSTGNRRTSTIMGDSIVYWKEHRRHFMLLRCCHESPEKKGSEVIRWPESIETRTDSYIYKGELE
jgi:hypothetical protein